MVKIIAQAFSLNNSPFFCSEVNFLSAGKLLNAKLQRGSPASVGYLLRSLHRSLVTVLRPPIREKVLGSTEELGHAGSGSCLLRRPLTEQSPIFQIA